MDTAPQEVVALLSDVAQFAPLTTHTDCREFADVAGTGGTVTIYTNTNHYAIRYRLPTDTSTGYLGCIASSRMPRAGEDWTRGRDLHDGPFSRETWRGILADIVSYEMVKVHKPGNPTVAAR